MVDHIRKLQAEAERKSKEAELAEEESEELKRESARLQEILARDVKQGNATLGDPVLDLALVQSGELDSSLASALLSLRQRWDYYQGERFLIETHHEIVDSYPPAFKRIKVLLGTIEGEITYYLDHLQLTAGDKYSKVMLGNSPSLDSEVIDRAGFSESVMLSGGLCSLDARDFPDYIEVEYGTCSLDDYCEYYSAYQHLWLGEKAVAEWLAQSDYNRTILTALESKLDSSL